MKNGSKDKYPYSHVSFRKYNSLICHIYRFYGKGEGVAEKLINFFPALMCPSTKEEEDNI